MSIATPKPRTHDLPLSLSDGVFDRPQWDDDTCTVEGECLTFEYTFPPGPVALSDDMQFLESAVENYVRQDGDDLFDGIDIDHIRVRDLRSVVLLADRSGITFLCDVEIEGTRDE